MNQWTESDQSDRWKNHASIVATSHHSLSITRLQCLPSETPPLMSVSLSLLLLSVSPLTLLVLLFCKHKWTEGVLVCRNISSRYPLFWYFESNFHTEAVILMLILTFLHDWAGWGWCGVLVVEGLWGWGGWQRLVMLQDRASGGEQKSMWQRKCKGRKMGRVEERWRKQPSASSH